MRYSEAFKQQVVDELEAGRFGSPYEASQAYGVDQGSVKRWARQYGKAHLLRKVVRVAKPNEPGEIKRLKDRVRRLEAALADSHMDQALDQAFFEILCERTGTDANAFKKSTLGRRPPGAGKDPRTARSKPREAVPQGGDDAPKLLQAEAAAKQAES